MDDFHSLAAGDHSGFPQYSFIEPRYFGSDENDQHPPADVRRGEALIADVYNAIRANKELWESTLLVVTCDEHGGFYDHVEPPETVAPDDHVAEWTFDRLGVRVPTILVSPWIKKGVMNTVFDHTSLLRYLCEKWNLDPLGARMQAAAGARRANNFADELTKLKEPRTDTPTQLIAATIPAVRGARVAKAPPIVGSREALMMFVDQLPEHVPDEEKDALRAARRGRMRRGMKARAGASPALSVARAEEKLERLRVKRQISR
jgi:hypothetical protein